MNGTEEDHAVLLYNYLSALNHQVYLVLGIGVPEGQTAQVLYKDKISVDGHYWLLNAVTGWRTDVRDSTCSLQQVWAILTADNVSHFNLKYFHLKLLASDKMADVGQRSTETPSKSAAIQLEQSNTLASSVRTAIRQSQSGQCPIDADRLPKDADEAGAPFGGVHS